MKVIQLYADGVPASTSVSPNFAGRTDAPITPYGWKSKALGQASGPAATVAHITPENGGSTEFDEWIKMVDFATGFGARTQLKMPFPFDDPDHTFGPVDPGDMPLTTYSVRMYFYTIGYFAGTVYRIVSFENNDAYTWSYSLSEPEAVPFYPLRYLKPQIRNGDLNATVLATVNSNAAQFTGTPGQQQAYQCETFKWRLELQVDEARSPKVVARLYGGKDNTVEDLTANSILSIQASPTTVAADRLILGDDWNTGYQNHTYVARVELHDNYDLSGQFTESQVDPTLTLPTAPTAASLAAIGTPYRRPKYRWFEWDGATLDNELDLLGVWDGDEVVAADDVDELRTRDIVNNDWEGYGWFLFGDVPPSQGVGGVDENGDPIVVDPEETGEDDTSLAWRGAQLPDTSGFRLSLYWPTGPEPVNGWPIVYFVHGGFFVAGSYRNMPSVWMKRFTNAGFAVASLGYRLSQTVILDVPYGSYPDAAVHPSHIHDVKNATNWLRMKGRSEGDDTYPVDTTLGQIIGYSAGGYIAYGAAYSHDLDDDDYGRDYRISSEDFGVMNAPGLGEPTYIAVAGMAAPTDLGIAIADDPTLQATPGIGFGSDGSIGLMEATALGLLGKRTIDARATNELEYAAIPHLLSKQAAASRPVPPTLYVRGKADHLVGAGHPAALAAAMATHHPGVDYQYHEIDAMHDTMVSQADYEHLIRWCRANIA